MTVEIPKEPVYYYECSHGKFRLVYFIPQNDLQQLVDDGQVSDHVLVDFPDGVDLDCTEPDFADFKSTYGFRPEYDPDRLRDAFQALFSTTNQWETFRGTGFVPPEEIEQLAGTIEDKLKSENLTVDDLNSLPRQPTIRDRQKFTRSRLAQQGQVRQMLIDLPAPKIDQSKTIKQQSFRKIKMEKGENIEEAFMKLHRQSGGQ